MSYKNQIMLGRITRVHGYEGTVVIKLEPGFVENIPEMESVFIEIDGRPVPFFISGSDYTGGETLKMKFEEYQSESRAAGFIGCRVFLTTSGIKGKEIQDPDSLTGFKIITKDKRITGTVSGVIQHPGHYLLTIVTPGNSEILVPLHEDLIIKINKKARTIIMDLPDGLADLNNQA